MSASFGKVPGWSCQIGKELKKVVDRFVVTHLAGQLPPVGGEGKSQTAEAPPALTDSVQALRWSDVKAQFRQQLLPQISRALAAGEARETARQVRAGLDGLAGAGPFTVQEGTLMALLSIIHIARNLLRIRKPTNSDSEAQGDLPTQGLAAEPSDQRHLDAIGAVFDWATTNDLVLWQVDTALQFDAEPSAPGASPAPTDSQPSTTLPDSITSAKSLVSAAFGLCLSVGSVAWALGLLGLPAGAPRVHNDAIFSYLTERVVLNLFYALGRPSAWPGVTSGLVWDLGLGFIAQAPPDAQPRLYSNFSIALARRGALTLSRALWRGVARVGLSREARLQALFLLAARGQEDDLMLLLTHWADPFYLPPGPIDPSDPSVPEATAPASAAPTIVPLTTAEYGQLLKLGLLSEVRGVVGRVLQFLTTSRLTPDAHVWGAVVEHYCKRDKLDKAYEILQVMRRSGLTPRGETYAALMKLHLRLKDPEAVKSLFLSMSAEGSPLTSQHYASFVAMAAMLGESVVVGELLSAMKNEGLDLDSRVVTALVKQTALHQSLPDAEELFFSFRRAVPHLLTAATYQVMVQQSLRASDLARATKFLRLMAQAGLRDDAFALLLFAKRFLRRNRGVARRLFRNASSIVSSEVVTARVELIRLAAELCLGLGEFQSLAQLLELAHSKGTVASAVISARDFLALHYTLLFPLPFAALIDRLQRDNYEVTEALVHKVFVWYCLDWRLPEALEALTWLKANPSVGAPSETQLATLLNTAIQWTGRYEPSSPASPPSDPPVAPTAASPATKPAQAAASDYFLDSSADSESVVKEEVIGRIMALIHSMNLSSVKIYVQMGRYFASHPAYGPLMAQLVADVKSITTRLPTPIHRAWVKNMLKHEEYDQVLEYLQQTKDRPAPRAVWRQLICEAPDEIRSQAWALWRSSARKPKMSREMYEAMVGALIREERLSKALAIVKEMLATNVPTKYVGYQLVLQLYNWGKSATAKALLDLLFAANQLPKPKISIPLLEILRRDHPEVAQKFVRFIRAHNKGASTQTSAEISITRATARGLQSGGVAKAARVAQDALA